MVIQPCRQFCLPLEGKDSNSRNHVYSVYNTLDYPIVIGKHFVTCIKITVLSIGNQSKTT